MDGVYDADDSALETLTPPLHAEDVGEPVHDEEFGQPLQDDYEQDEKGEEIKDEEADGGLTVDNYFANLVVKEEEEDAETVIEVVDSDDDVHVKHEGLPKRRRFKKRLASPVK